MWQRIGKVVCFLIGHPEPIAVWCPVDDQFHWYCMRCGTHAECSVE